MGSDAAVLYFPFDSSFLNSEPDSSLDRRLALSIFTVDNVQWQLETAPNPYLCYPAYPPIGFIKACVSIETLPF
ncbi:hypothetical protein K435DRAFT_771937 [Dendrothele bispora CBS 962.96]|uniref:Uncharacterized protein n=1 Tax=Dendrothele bispora (strain CBS 962.96) TaxID=1314807 RepID=A0A4S8MYQ6_DENBC|nr:hypothetical protein K435DRAFT_780589 [Dendrothele bispora CBS 962.96]THV08435.1 hypothetical protein K435DRAFT_771937 [Dendrothele bispora CBS 962.96]